MPESKQRGLWPGAISVWGASPSITDCVFRGNAATFGASAIGLVDSSSEIRNCVFSFNAATALSSSVGGAIVMSSGGGVKSVRLVNCSFFDNTSTKGGALALDAATAAVVVNCTFSHNVGRDRGGAIWIASGATGLTVVDSILWGDSPEEILSEGTTSISMAYSDVSGGASGVGNINTDPLFVDEIGRDFRLQGGSPCIDTGRNTGTSEFGNVLDDIEGNPRG